MRFRGWYPHTAGGESQRTAVDPKRGEPHVGFAWVLHVMIYTSDMSVRDTSVCCTERQKKQEFERAESVASACGLRENNNTLPAIRVKHGKARL
jgi:hypothetical protein